MEYIKAADTRSSLFGPDTAVQNSSNEGARIIAKIAAGGYPLDSPRRNGLCFARRFFFACVNDLVASDRIDGDGLLRQAVEQLAPAT